MKTTTALFLLFITNLAFGQYGDDDLENANWKIGQEMNIFGNTIVRLEGKNITLGMLNVGYKTLSQLLAEVELMAEREMWLNEKKEDKKSFYEKYAGGGIIYLYLTRYLEGAADMKQFTVIVRDSTDINEIYRKELDSEYPILSINNEYWWNSTMVFTPNQTKGNIFIYVIDKLGGDNNKFKFEVKL
jgi:hypothetical protein